MKASKTVGTHPHVFVARTFSYVTNQSDAILYDILWLPRVSIAKQ